MQQGDLIDFPGILGKEISEVEQLLLINDFLPNENIPQSYNLNDTIKSHFGLNYLGINIRVDEHDTVNAISLVSTEVVSKETFEVLKLQFGEPSAIKVIDQEIVNSSSSDSNNNHSFKKCYVTLKEGTFDDKPLMISLCLFIGKKLTTKLYYTFGMLNNIILDSVA